MTDEELIARLRDAKRDWPEFGHDRAEAADRIESLTAQLAEDADARSLMDDRLEQLVAEVDALTAERDRLREALAECAWFTGICGETARAALKGKTP